MNSKSELVSRPHFSVPVPLEAASEQTSDADTIRRIEACIQACEGLTTEELERGIVQDMRRVIGQVVPVLQEKERLEQQLRQMMECSVTCDTAGPAADSESLPPVSPDSTVIFDHPF